MTIRNHTIQRDFCNECGMRVHKGEFHPYAACLMYKTCRDATVVRANLRDWENLRSLERKVLSTLRENLTPQNKITKIHQLLRECSTK